MVSNVLNNETDYVMDSHIVAIRAQYCEQGRDALRAAEVVTSKDVCIVDIVWVSIIAKSPDNVEERLARHLHALVSAGRLTSQYM
jgi:hypothetical protein